MSAAGADRVHTAAGIWSGWGRYGSGHAWGLLEDVGQGYPLSAGPELSHYITRVIICDDFNITLSRQPGVCIMCIQGDDMKIHNK